MSAERTAPLIGSMHERTVLARLTSVFQSGRGEVSRMLSER